MSSRNISDLDKRIQDRVIELLNITIDGYEPFITDGYRSNEEQTKLYNQGRTTPGKIVTYAQAGQSPHNYGLAVDLAWRRPGTKEALWTLSLYKKLADKAFQLGFDWGGAWTGGFKDNPHYEIKNWRNYINNSNPIGGTMPDTGNKELEECLRLHSQLVDETVKLKEDKQKLEDTIESLKSNHSKEVDDLKAQVSGSKEEARQQKDAFKDHRAWEAGALNTTQDVAQIRAEIVRLVTIEDQKNKVDKELGFAVSELSTRNKQVDDLNNTVDRLKEELKIAKGLGDASTAELITEIIKRLTNILRKS